MSAIAPGFFFSLLTAVIVIIGDVVIKHAADAGRPIYSGHVLIGCVIYGGSALAWYGAMLHLGLGQGGVVYAMFTLLTLCALGGLFFDEQFGLRELLGILCALASLALLARHA